MSTLVDRILGSIDVAESFEKREDFVGIRTVLAETSRHHIDVQNDIRKIVTEGITPIDQDSQRLLSQMLPRSTGPDPLGLPPGETIFLAVLYLKAFHLLRLPGTTEKVMVAIRSRKPLHQGLESWFREGGPNFKGQLAVAAEQRAASDPAFAAALDNAVREIQQVSTRMLATDWQPDERGGKIPGMPTGESTYTGLIVGLVIAVVIVILIALGASFV